MGAMMWVMQVLASILQENEETKYAGRYHPPTFNVKERLINLHTMI